MVIPDIQLVNATTLATMPPIGAAANPTVVAAISPGIKPTRQQIPTLKICQARTRAPKSRCLLKRSVQLKRKMLLHLNRLRHSRKPLPNTRWRRRAFLYTTASSFPWLSTGR